MKKIKILILTTLFFSLTKISLSNSQESPNLNTELQGVTRFEQNLPPSINIITPESTKFLNLLNEIRTICPECNIVEGNPASNPIRILPLPTLPTLPTTNVLDLSHRCSIPDWLSEKKNDLMQIATRNNIQGLSQDCDRDYILEIIEQLSK